MEMRNNISLFSGIGGLNLHVQKLMAKIEELPDVGGLGDAEFRISSKEIARVTGKWHQHVMRDIRALLEQDVDASNFGLTTYKDKSNREKPCYMLTRKGVLLLTSGYSAKLREAVIDRWEELEKQRIAEERNPSLSVDKAIAAWKRQGKSDEWITQRTQGISQRHAYTDTLKAHGVDGKGYGKCTNAIYKPILGGTRKDIAKRRNLPSGSFRDHLSGVELAAVALSEALASERIEGHDARGNDECANHSHIAASNVSRAITLSRE